MIITLLLVLPPKKERKLKIPKSDVETKDEFLESIPKIVENKANSYILMQVRNSIKNEIKVIFIFTYNSLNN